MSLPSCACCYEPYVTDNRGPVYSIACEPCLESGCTTKECFKPEVLGEPLPALDVTEISDGFDKLLDRVPEPAR